jgi:hypothetical protein
MAGLLLHHASDVKICLLPPTESYSSKIHQGFLLIRFKGKLSARSVGKPSL